MSMEEDEVGTDFDGESGSRMNDDQEDDDQGYDDNNSDYAYEEDGDGDENHYEFEDEDHEQPQYVKTYTGIQFEGNLHEMMKDPGKNALYPVYKQLSELCLVDIQEDFFSALLTIGVKDQILMVSITFPKKEPMFPNAPPQLDLQSKFKAPNEKYNLLFNCHPQLLSTQWNFCTDIVQIIRDLIELASQCVVDTVDDDYYTGQGVQRMIIKMIRHNLLDITSLFPDTAASKLPSFGILRDPVASKDSKGTKPKGTGYSSHSGDGVSRHWDVSAHITAKLEGIQEITEKVQSEIQRAAEKGLTVDPMIIDSVYFIYSHTISRTVTMEEFFRNLPFYDLVLDCLLPLPPPSGHIAPIQSLMKLYVQITSGRIAQSLEDNEKEIVDKLKVLYDRLNTSFQGAVSTDGSTGSNNNSVKISGSAEENSTDGDMCVSPDPLPAEQLLGEEAGRVTRSSATKKRHLNNSEDTSISTINTTTTTTTTSATTPRSFIQSIFGGSKSNTSSNTNITITSTTSVTPAINYTTTGKPSTNPSETLFSVHEIPRVVELEEAFLSHKYASDMRSVGHVNAKWYRRQHMELGTMPESLPENVIVFSGMQCSQPNLMKILMFPESPDTPYCGGCFEFDAFIPLDYPNVPPKCNLITTGYGTVRFNPNLYNCGKVCLSLLGTWSGEKWNPEVSSMSQVINSILFLIFVEHPYFNEPGFQSSQGSPQGDKQSEAYNQVIRAATLKFAYLEHFKKCSTQLSRYVLPVLCANWRSKGHATALGWAASQPTLRGTIDAIETEVVKRVGGVSVGVVNGELPGTASATGTTHSSCNSSSSSSSGGVDANDSSGGGGDVSVPMSGEKAGL